MDLGHLYFVVRGYIYKVNLDQLSQETAPSVEFVVDFKKEGMPLGMGGFALNSKLHLLGGEIVGEGRGSGWRIPRGVLDRVSSTIFVYDPSSPGKQFYSPRSDIIPPMIGAKANPKITTIGGKVYVLGSAPRCRTQHIPSPAFECYDPSCSRWVELPEPPHYRDPTVAYRFGACSLLAYFVMGRKIYIKNSFGVSFYDVDMGKWKDATSILGEGEHKSASLPFYNRLAETTSVAEGENGIVVAYTRGGLKAYSYGVDGAFQFERRLSEIDDNFGISKENIGFVYFLGEGKFCFVLSSRTVKNIHWAVRITIFSVNVQVDAYLDVVVLHLHDYDFTNLFPDYDFFDFENVLIVSSVEELPASLCNLIDLKSRDLNSNSIEQD